jgi:fructuronate reductase
MAQLPGALAGYGYDRGALKVGIVHLGIGAFHRAHQAVYVDDLLRQGAGHWRIAGVSLRSAGVHAQLDPQDCLYTVTLRDQERVERRLIGAVAEVLVAPDAPQTVTARLADPEVFVVTLTLTEKGYGVDPLTGRLDGARADVAADLVQQMPPRTALGYLAHGLDLRRREGRGGLTLISCDNLAGNGRRLQSALLDLCEARGDGLGQWIARHCSFPNSVVDRMVPATRESDRAALEAEIGVRDEAAVFAEPFGQWMLERRFAGPVPPWEDAGVQLIEDVAPFEAMKLRLLNAGHSLVAYLGVLAGFDTVADACAEPAVRTALQALIETEASPSLQLPASYPLAEYRRQLLTRFSNRALQRRTAQIAEDGSQKIPQRLLPTLQWQLRYAGHIRSTSLAIAAWLRYTRGIDEKGRAIAVVDPLEKEISALQRQSSGAAAMERLLRCERLFGRTFLESPAAARAVADWLDRFDRRGVLAAVRDEFAAPLA